MKTLVIYDEKGTIIEVRQGTNFNHIIGKIDYKVVEIEDGKQLTGVNSNGELIIEDLPKSDLEIAKDRIQALEESNAELITLMSMTQNA